MTDLPEITMLYDVTFSTWTEPDPRRLGTSEKALGKIRVWAKNADEAIRIAKEIAKTKNLEWLATFSVDSVSGVYLENILNDPLNPHAVLPDSGTRLQLV